MKKFLLSLVSLFMLTLFAQAGEVVIAYPGGTTTNMTGENDAAAFGLSTDDWSIVGDKGNNQNLPGLNKAGDFRLYWAEGGGNTITITVKKEGSVINKIKSMSFNTGKDNVTVSVDGNLVEPVDGEYTINATSFVLGNGNTSNVQVQIKNILLDVEGLGGEVAAVATPTFTPNGGTFVGTTSVEIACETEGATIYYSMNGQDPVAGSSPQYGRALPITETTTVKAIAVKGDDQSAVASATFTQIPSYSSFASMSSLANNDLFAYTGSAFVLANVAKAGSNTKYVYIYDGNDFALIYDQTGEKSVAAEKGKYITPGWTGKVSIFNKLRQLVPDNAIVVNDDPAQPVNYPAIVLGNAVMNQVITLKDVTYFSVDDKNISITVNNEDKDISEAQGVFGYNQFGIEIPEFVEGKTYQIVGAIGQYKDKVQFWPIEIKEQVEETPEPDPEFYIVGTMTNWQIDPNYKMTLNEKAGEGIKELSVTMTLAAGDEFKAVSSTDGSTIKSWFPDGMENNYVISEAGDYTIYFRPNADGGDDWHYNVLYVSKKVEPIYIETDLTSQFSALTDRTKWTGATGYTATNFCPKVTTNAGQEVQVCEKYETTCANTGDVFYQTVTGLTPGTYKIELYGGAAFTFGRGFGSMAFTGDLSVASSETYQAGDKIEPTQENPTGVTLSATTSEGVYGGEIPIYYATNFPDGAATVVLDGVVVGENGEVKIGMSKTSQSTNWHVIQLKGVTAQVNAVELHANELAAAQAALNAEENAIVTGDEKTALETAISENATVAEQTADAYKAAIKALSDATAAFTGAKAAYQALADAQAYLVDLPYADAAKKPAAEAATNAADATAKAEALMVALRAYYESAALAENVAGAKVMTDSIKNPKAEDGINNWTVVLGEGSSGNIDVKSNEPWTDAAGVAEHKYFDGGNWGAQAWDVALEQKIALPAGKYLLTTIARAEKAVDLTLYAGADSVKMPAISSVGGVFNRGWNNAAVEFEMAEADSIVIGVRGVTAEVHNWMSFSDFRLVQLEEGAEPAEPVYYVVGTMNNWTPSDEYKMTLNEEAEGVVEYMITLDLEANAELKVVKNNSEVWYPEGMDNNYVISEDGEYTIYFRPNADGGDDWHYNVLYVSKKVEPIYIETDLTAQFNSLATTQWTGSSGQVTWAAPKVTTNSGLEVAAWERYNGSCDWTGEIMSSSVTGLTPGTYKIELYGAAAFTFDRGFGSTHFTGDFSKDKSETYNENDAITENTGVTLFAETSEGTVSEEIPIYYATNFNTSGIATATLENVVVGDAGTIKIGLSKTSTSTNWHVVQLKGVTAQVDAVELHASVLAAAQAALNAEENAIVTGEEKTTLETAIRENATVAEQTADAYKAAIKALSDATAAFTGAKAAYQALADAQAYLVDLPYADAAKKPAAEAATNAADATAKAEALMVALRAYYESAALAENVAGAKVMTDSIKNPKAEDGINNWTVVLGEGSSGNIDVKSNEPWTDAAGVAEHKYFDGGNWGAQAWDVALEQKIALPAGKYLLTTIARAEKAVDLTLYAGADSVKMPAISSVGGVFNRGWNNAAVEFEMAEADSIVIGVRGVTNAQYNWMSFSDFRLVQLEEPAVAPTYYVVGTMNDWTPSDEYKMTLNEEAEGTEYMFTFDAEANTELKVVKGNKDVWYPDGMDNNFQISDAGNYTIYFRPNADGGDNWYYQYIFAIKNESEELIRSWDFTQWSEETVANLKADAAASKLEGWSDVEKKTDAEADADPTEASKDNCFWLTDANGGELTANGVVIKELKGLVFDAGYAQKRSLAIAVNYPSTSLGDYAGPAYLWLGGGGSKQTVPCFTIPTVKAGQYITVEMESHKPSDARGIELYANTYASENKIGEAFKPTEKATNSWKIEEDCDVVVWNTSGCHIYTLSVDDVPTAITTINANVEAKGIYNMNGQKVNKAQKGLYIINGKKVVIK